MDYEKEYKEALERAKAGKPLDEVFPELKESEDERIRKEIQEFLRSNCGAGQEAYKKCEEWCYWIEKQKEQKPEIKYVYQKFRKGDVIEPITPNGHCMPVRVVDIWNGSYSCRSDDDKAYLSLPIRNEDEYRLAQQGQPEDLEKEINACWRNWLSPSNQKEVEGVLPKTEFAMYARHFYELGLNARK